CTGEATLAAIVDDLTKIYSMPGIRQGLSRKLCDPSCFACRIFRQEATKSARRPTHCFERSAIAFAMLGQSASASPQPTLAVHSTEVSDDMRSLVDARGRPTAAKASRLCSMKALISRSL